MTTTCEEERTVLKPWDKGFDASKLPKTIRTVAKVFSKPGQEEKRAELKAKRQASMKKNGIQYKSDEVRSLAAKVGVSTRVAERAANGKGIAVKHLMSMEEKMIEHNFDPLDLLMNVAQGKALYDDHPFMPVMSKYLDEIHDRVEHQDGYGVKDLLQRLRVEGAGYLVDSYTPKEARINVAKELLQYTRPKLKQTEHIVKTGDEDNQGNAEPLTQEDVEVFKKWFSEEY